MNLQSFNAAVEAAEAFLARAKRVEWTEVKCDDGNRLSYATNGKANGAVKRASLDLTRALAEMRKP